MKKERSVVEEGNDNGLNYQISTYMNEIIKEKILLKYLRKQFPKPDYDLTGPNNL